MTVLVIGGAGFRGANFVLDWVTQSAEPARVDCSVPSPEDGCGN